ncbi:MAG: DinB family protein [Pseudomonadota bacterium]|nr:DinB family protein [Pseudomonadota bacterium]
MITPDYARTMAAYNRWQNESIYGAAAGLSDEERRRDRGAFFGSIHRTLSHLRWGDEIWLSRFGDFPPPPPTASLGGSAAVYDDWEELRAGRIALDETIIGWAASLTPRDLEGDLTWFSGAMKREITRPRALLVAHMFNHQTHHRGQAHAMLTAAGAKPDDTDLPFIVKE